jgi:hypothetical protein
MILLLFRIHAVAAGLVFLALAVSVASRRERRAWFWIAAASAAGCAVALTFAHVVGVTTGAMMLATSAVAHMLVQSARPAMSVNARASLRKRRRLDRTGDRTGSRRAAKARQANADRFSNTG